VDHADVLAQLQQLPPMPDARAALERADRAFVLTNGGREGGENLLRHAGLDDLVERVFGVDEVRAYKPDPRPYELVLRELARLEAPSAKPPAPGRGRTASGGPGATLVAAHAWDVVGAVRAGLRGVWVNREERAWPFPEEVAPHATAPGLLEAVG
jgi:2-haloacid dehalogenase